MKELAEENIELEEKVVSIIEEGNNFNTIGDFDSALKSYETAWLLLPEPKLEWEMLSSWLSGSFYTAYFNLAIFEKAKHWAEAQLKATSSSIDTAPLIDLGMVCYELKQYDESYKYFDDAYSYGKARAFKERPKKYLEFYLERKNNPII
ncbi:hypothetical protein [Morganella morganii]|uniref:hypothetical protein n=1 Tax=Morganella morganii TaxID=582 RepID=UPI00091E06F3|nr:hypothetical protein [Morganella morganii]SHM51733.1 hypothetical protein SAMN05216301_2438 [Morganella morganii]